MDTVLTADCRRCSESFAYRHDACPNCGWQPETWRQGGWYGFGRPGIGER